MKKFLFLFIFFIGFSSSALACTNDASCTDPSFPKCYLPNDAAYTGTCVTQERFDELNSTESGGGSTVSEFSPVEVDLKDKGYAGGGLSSIISGIIKLIFIIATLAAFGFLIFGGVEWITSGGDSGKIQSARNKIVQAVIGLLVLASTWAIMNFVVGLLGHDSFEDSVENTPSLKE